MRVLVIGGSAAGNTARDLMAPYRFEHHMHCDTNRIRRELNYRNEFLVKKRCDERSIGNVLTRPTT
jgi:hypothetical protein